MPARKGGAGRAVALAATGALGIAQLLHLPRLMERVEQLRGSPSFHDSLRAGLALEQGCFHLAGTAFLVAFQLALWTPRWPRPKARAALNRSWPSLAVLLFSGGIWLLWAGAQADVFSLALVGAIGGLVLPLAGVALLVPLCRKDPEDGRLDLLVALSIITWIWSVLFALTQFIGGVSA